MDLTLLGGVLTVSAPEDTIHYLKKCLSLPADIPENGNRVPCPNCDILIQRAEVPAPVQTGAEGYYTGLCHLAFRSGDLKKDISRFTEAGIPLVGGSAISYNPLVWGTGMDYINPECPFGFGMEFCARLDLSDKPETVSLGHIGIPVPNLQESFAWYETLGFTVGSCATIHRDSDGAVILVAMMEGFGTILELYEFTGMDHAPFVNQAFSSLRFAFHDEKTGQALIEMGARNMAEGKWELSAPGGEKIEFLKGANAQ